MRRLLGLVFLFPVAAGAQDISDLALQPVGKNLICYLNYPADAVRHNQTGTATLLFRVGADGHVSKVIVAASSGYDILDRNSIACAKTWQFRPALRDGQPIEAPVSATIQWAINTSPWRLAVGLRLPFDACLPPQDATKKRGVTVVSYNMEKGAVSDVAVKESSGDDGLDRQAMACVSAWHFEPTTVEPTVAVIAQLFRPGETAPSNVERSQESLTPYATTGPGIAKFDWRDLDKAD